MRSRSAAFAAKVITGCMSGWSVESVTRPVGVRLMAGEIIGGQPVQLGRRGLDGLARPPECCG